MSLQQIRTDKAYESSAPLSQAIRYENTVHVSGNVPVDPETGDLVEGGVEAQTRMVLENIEAILEEAGTSMNNVIRTRIFLTDMNAFNEMNKVYEEFVSEPYPARTAVKAEMASPEILVEIDVTAAVTS
jgi:2-iminobutanoate/2-iminopropanoate deaminase